MNKKNARNGVNPPMTGTADPKAKGSFDAMGHRINRNAENDHRNSAKVAQINPDGGRTYVIIPLEYLAKLRVYLRGKTVKAEAYGGRKVRKPTRAMTVGDLVREYVKVIVRGVKLDDEAREWYETQLKKNKDLRERQNAMVAAGINRIPKEEQLKRGRVAKK